MTWNIKKIFTFLRSRFIDQKKFKFLNLEIGNFKYSLAKNDEKLRVFLSSADQKKAIEEDLFPHFDDQQEYFKQFLNFDREDVLCYLCKKDNKIVHYFLVFTDVKNSPLKKTKFSKLMDSFPNSAYLGNAFTITEERGGWIVLQVLSRIIDDLKKLHGIKNILVLIHTDTKGALKFYQKLGFKIVS